MGGRRPIKGRDEDGQQARGCGALPGMIHQQQPPAEKGQRTGQSLDCQFNPSAAQHGQPEVRTATLTTFSALEPLTLCYDSARVGRNVVIRPLTVGAVSLDGDLAGCSARCALSMHAGPCHSMQRNACVPVCHTPGCLITSGLQILGAATRSSGPNRARFFRWLLKPWQKARQEHSRPHLPVHPQSPLGHAVRRRR
ncbi:hypothetical protein MAPG_01113 [Magnaporthiopsis poae ATCC 64411]|uniref:Uncharacterized protein n=1 Tax=Magnaporthiopsis poae (strain ATCC 64411 / 73-15) TaxID=644358 RepID=A0A0C4DMU8_MAGP6|nr:hypothetical protein MAPG_01113 [Magnaporthiopsis poae ATCC 64411]